jgi:hypothetical protein
MKTLVPTGKAKKTAVEDGAAARVRVIADSSSSASAQGKSDSACCE